MTRTILIATLLWTCAAIAQTPGPIAGPGTASCGDWHAARQGQGPYRWESDVAWFRGFIAAHNVYAQPPANKLITAEPNDVVLWVDTYCQTHPTNNLMQAATAYAAAHGGRDPFSERGSK
jgi:hypothetical protein